MMMIMMTMVMLLAMMMLMMVVVERRGCRHSREPRANPGVPLSHGFCHRDHSHHHHCHHSHWKIFTPVLLLDPVRRNSRFSLISNDTDAGAGLYRVGEAIHDAYCAGEEGVEMVLSRYCVGD